MSTTQRIAVPTVSHSRSIRAFALHYAEMVIAMFVGMAVLAPLTEAVWPEADSRGDAAAMLMASHMAAGMVVWMRIRHHSWGGIARMTAAMYVPFAVLLPPYWAGLLSASGLMTWGHVLMFPAMALAMLPVRGRAHRC